jgi:ferric-dicitrate binding protein FerR (iron transport regulator)
MLPEEIDTLLARYFSGETTDEDMCRLEEWLAQSAAHEKYFEELTFLFEKAAPPAGRPVDVAQALAGFRQHMQLPALPDKAPIRTAHLYWPAAAAIILLIGLFVLFPRMRKEAAPYFATADTPAQYYLPDSTLVLLSPHSRIAWNGRYGEQERVVQLTGKATFHTGALGQGAFTVLAGETLIRDIGTVFTVDAFAERDTVMVAVESGLVLFSVQGGTAGVELAAGEAGAFSKRSRTFTAVQRQPLVFEAAPLQEVAARLLQRYGVHIVLADASLHHRRISVRFEEGEDIASVMDIIAETLSLHLTNEHGTYTLSLP